MGFVFVTNEVACNYFALAQYSLVTPLNKATVWCTVLVAQGGSKTQLTFMCAILWFLELFA